jgi:hypothetical protein
MAGFEGKSVAIMDAFIPWVDESSSPHLISLQRVSERGSFFAAVQQYFEMFADFVLQGEDIASQSNSSQKVCVGCRQYFSEWPIFSGLLQHVEESFAVIAQLFIDTLLDFGHGKTDEVREVFAYDANEMFAGGEEIGFKIIAGEGYPNFEWAVLQFLSVTDWNHGGFSAWIHLSESVPPDGPVEDMPDGFLFNRGQESDGCMLTIWSHLEIGGQFFDSIVNDIESSSEFLYTFESQRG